VYVGKHIVAVVMAAVACCCSWYVYRVMGKKEGVTEQELAAPLTALVAACVSIVMAVFNAAWYLLYDREDLKAWRDERRNQAGPQLRKLLDCIRNEADNFDKLHNGKPPFSQYTEIKPFELLKKDLQPISDLWGYRRWVKKLLAEISRVEAMPTGQKNVVAFLPLVKKLEQKLEVDVKGYPKSEK